MEHDPTTGAGPETTGNDLVRHWPSDAPVDAYELVAQRANDETPRSREHDVERGRRLEGTCARPSSRPARPRGQR